MSLTLYYHPLSSFCHKVLIALYENGTPFTPHFVNLGDPAENAAFKKIWPIGKFPVLRDEARGVTIPESTAIIEYLAQYFPGRTLFLPADPELARQTRLADRFYDLHVHVPMQKIITDPLRPTGQNDSFGVAQSQAVLDTACGMMESEMASRSWAMGTDFTLADCAAAPALFYADRVLPLADAYPNLAAYRKRLMQRPSYARALKEAEPYFGLVPR